MKSSLILNLSNNSYGIGIRVKLKSSHKDLEKQDLNDLLELTLSLMSKREKNNCTLPYDEDMTEDWVSVYINGGEEIYCTKVAIIRFESKIDMIIDVDNHQVERL